MTSWHAEFPTAGEERVVHPASGAASPAAWFRCDGLTWTLQALPNATADELEEAAAVLHVAACPDSA